MTALFLDSCTFLAYSYPHEDNHPVCRLLFEGAFERFTGIRVKSEIGKKLNKRKLLYIELTKYLSNGGTPEDFVALRQMNDNDKRHFETQLRILNGQPKEDVLLYLRDKDRITRKGIAFAFTKVQTPLIGISSDSVCETLVADLIENLSDAQIFVDAFCWSEKKPTSFFVTLDWTDFVSKRDDIDRVLCNYRFMGSPNDLSLRIKHVSEILGNSPAG